MAGKNVSPVKRGLKPASVVKRSDLVKPPKKKVQINLRPKAKKPKGIENPKIVAGSTPYGPTVVPEGTKNGYVLTDESLNKFQEAFSKEIRKQLKDLWFGTTNITQKEAAKKVIKEGPEQEYGAKLETPSTLGNLIQVEIRPGSIKSLLYFLKTRINISNVDLLRIVCKELNLPLEYTDLNYEKFMDLGHKLENNTEPNTLEYLNEVIDYINAYDNLISCFVKHLAEKILSHE